MAVAVRFKLTVVVSVTFAFLFIVIDPTGWVTSDKPELEAETRADDPKINGMGSSNNTRNAARSRFEPKNLGPCFCHCTVTIWLFTRMVAQFCHKRNSYVPALVGMGNATVAAVSPVLGGVLLPLR